MILNNLIENTKVNCDKFTLVAPCVETCHCVIKPKILHPEKQQIVPLESCDCKEGILFEIY